VDGYVVPLRLHPAFFALVRGDDLLSSPAAYLASPTCHMVGCRGEHVAALFAVLPALDDLHRRRVLARAARKEAAAAAEAAALDTCSADSAASTAGLAAAAALDAVARDEAALFGRPHAFTAGQPLGEWLEALAWADPTTGTPLPPPPFRAGGGNGDAADKEEEEEEEDDDDVQEDCDGESFDAWDAEVTPRRLRWFLRFVASAWLGAGVALQVASFKEGLGDLVGLDSGALAFEAAELAVLFCGPDEVAWDEKSLRRTLRPQGGFEKDENTMVWLRGELADMPNARRLDFLELVTGQRLLLPDQVLTVRLTQERWPFFHSCTNQLDLPRYGSRASLRAALDEALAHGKHGGFSEFAHIGAGAGGGSEGGGEGGGGGLFEIGGLGGGGLGRGGGSGGGIVEALGANGHALGALLGAGLSAGGGAGSDGGAAAAALRRALASLGEAHGMDPGALARLVGLGEGGGGSEEDGDADGGEDDEEDEYGEAGEGHDGGWGEESEDEGSEGEVYGEGPHDEGEDDDEEGYMD